MAIASVRDLVEALSRGRLLETHQLSELGRTLPSRPGDPMLLARELLQRGWLTPYQINQLFQGHVSDLNLDHYVLLERLGEGGMGQVFKAREVRLGRLVALKVLRKERTNKPEIVDRFYQEIQAAAQLSHPNIVHAYDAEQVGDAHVFSMEYVDGIDLSRLVKQSGPLPVAQACECIRQAAVGLQHIHEHQMVHRDIKPANLMRAHLGGTVKILDMGLARLREAEAEEAKAKRLTRLGVVMGTIDFIPPEQALDSRRADIRSDLYSLGCTFYFLLTGKVPFPIDEPMAKLLAHSCETAAPIEQLRPETPERVRAIVCKLMAKRPEERYQTPAELIQDLAALSPAPAPPQAIPLAQPLNSSPPPVAILVSQKECVTPPMPYAPATWRGLIRIAVTIVLILALLGLIAYLV
ncbi:MAG TPA: serine/threonine-protein kinase [Gemmataceae bacterium]|nr:serine/threonine-protein kinase [Gemmataceae bacterium]